MSVGSFRAGRSCFHALQTPQSPLRRAAHGLIGPTETSRGLNDENIADTLTHLLDLGKIRKACFRQFFGENSTLIRDRLLLAEEHQAARSQS